MKPRKPYMGQVDMANVRQYRQVFVNGELVGATWYSVRFRLWSGRAHGNKRLIKPRGTEREARQSVSDAYCLENLNYRPENLPTVY